MHGFPPILAALLNPALLYGGAAAVSVPILIHLLARRRFKRIRWAAMEFLLQAQRRNRRRLRMEEWILLALRCAAVMALGAMFARPFVEPSGLAAALRRSQRTERIFLIDDSFSMGYQSPDGTPFSRAKEATRRIWDSLRRDSADDTVTVFRMSTTDEPVGASVFLSGPQAETLLSKLEAMQVSQAAMDPRRVLKAVADSLERSPDLTATAVYVVSDFQRKDWVRPGSTPGSDGAAELFEPLTAWAKRDRGLRIVLIDVGDDERLNTAVVDADVESGRVVAGASGTLRATITNIGPRSRDDLELQVAIGSVPQASKSLRSLGPAQTVEVDVGADFPRPGFETVRIEIPRDRLPADDVRYLSVEAVSAIRILIVNGEPAADVYTDEVSFLSTALRPEGEVFSGNEVTVVEESEFETTNLNNFHLVVLANVYRVSDVAAEGLQKYVREGGGLLIFLGDQVDADAYNVGLFRDGAGLLPGTLTETRRPTEPVHLTVADRLHPALRGLASDGDPLGLGQVPFLEFVGSKPAVAENTGGRSPSLPSNPNTRSEGSDPTDFRNATGGANSATPPGARVLAQFDDADRSPAIVERELGAGRVILVMTTADKEWHLWPDHPTFLPVMMELAHYAARRGATDDSKKVGEPLVLPVDPAEFEPDAFVRSPGYPNEPEAAIRAANSEDGKGLEFRWSHTDSAGFYQIAMRRRDGTDSPRTIAVNVDSAESDLSGATEDELRRSFPGIRLEYVKGLRGLAEATSEARVEVWRWLLALAAAALLTEHGLAWVWGKRR